VKRSVATDKAPVPAANAPYNQAIVVGDLVFVTGQIGLEPGGTELEGGVKEQTEQLFHNLAAILEAAGSSLDQMVKTTVFLVDLGDFEAMNEVYARFAGEVPPARSTIAVSQLALGARVEIEVVARVDALE
jgi:2-iminobutanoate/2-iminopropanoate deaminase